MEFGEKLQELRKSRGLTQEELAEALYVSRTAVSKWESGRGYPNIDSLKEISKYFSVTIDDLLSGEKLLSIAEKESRSDMRKLCDLLLGMTDLCALMLIVLPLYPKTVDHYIYAVNLFAYTEVSARNRSVYWVAFVTLIIIGMLKVLLVQLDREGLQNALTKSSVAVSIAAVLFLAIAGETYVIVVAFLLLVFKGMLLFKYAKTDKH